MYALIVVFMTLGKSVKYVMGKGWFIGRILIVLTVAGAAVILARRLKELPRCNWIGIRKTIGRGEGSSGLKFDQIIHKNNI